MDEPDPHREAKREHDRIDREGDRKDEAAIKYGEVAIKAVILANGGAVAAVLAFLGSLSGNKGLVQAT